MTEKADDRLLPANKIRTIMKSCGDPNALLSKESILVVTKAAELFIAYLANQTLKYTGGKKELNYNALSDFVQKEEKLEFLHQIVPKKITVKEFREILERGSDSSDSDVDSSESESGDSDESGSDEEDEEAEEEGGEEEDGEEDDDDEVADEE